MRIVSGTYRGRVIEAPAGQGTRPTTDRVREALMSSLASLRDGFAGARVLDAFAGSGALGLEALSRGAESAVFFERDHKALKAIERNIAALKLSRAQAHLVRQDVFKAAPAAFGAAFDIVFLDPPYAYDAAAVLGLVQSLKAAGKLAPQATVVYEHALEDAAAVSTKAGSLAGFEVAVQKKYGKTGVTMIEVA